MSCKRQVAALAAVLITTGLMLAAGSPSQAAGCTPDVRVVYHYQGAVIVRILKGCGHEYAAWGEWAKNGKRDIDTGTFRTYGFAHVCDAANCVSHPDGRLAEGGWQRKGHPRRCAFGCAG